MRENEAGTSAEDTDEIGATSGVSARPRRRAARPAGPPPEVEETSASTAPPEEPEPAPKAAGRGEKGEGKPARSRSRKRAEAPVAVQPVPTEAEAEPEEEPELTAGGVPTVTFQPPMVVFQPPEVVAQPVVKPAAAPVPMPVVAPEPEPEHEHDDHDDHVDDDGDDTDDEGGDRPSRRRRRRGGRGRGKGREARDEDDEQADEEEPAAAEQPAEEPKAGRKGRGSRAAKAAPETPEADAGAADDDEGDEGGGSTRRRRRRRRRSAGSDGEDATTDDPPNTVVHVRAARTAEARSAEARSAIDEVQSVRGSTRLEAKKQRRREGREQGRRRPPVITEAEFLARREAVERVMVIRQRGERTQIAVLEDEVLVEHYVDRATHQSYVGNVYLGKVQNVLPSMEAAFVDIGKGRNAVLYAGEVNWDASGLEGQPRRIESALRSGQSVLVQVTKDPMGHKGARLTSQISLPGRYLVYVPDGSMTGISRKLPDKERTRLKQILKRIMPDNAGVIVRTAAEGATEEELARDVSRLTAQWENIQRQAKTAGAPSLLYGEPDLTIRVVRDIFNEDFTRLVVDGPDAWDMVAEYVEYVAPHLADRAERWERDDQDVMAAYRIDEQIAKAMERKVWLPSGGSLVIDRTEAMTVVDVNTGKYTGQGGNLEETVTRNNLEAAEEIVRQLRLRDIGGIIVIDFIDMVLESNRDLVLRRLLECLSRDRTKHQVAEVTSLGLVQMTRKRVGQGLLEAFSEVCECCNGRGIHVQVIPAELKPEKAPAAGGSRRRKRKGEVEKAVEDKLARHETEQTERAEPVETVLEAAPPAAAVATLEEPRAEDGPAAGTGRRRRARRPRTRIEDPADTPETPDSAPEQAAVVAEPQEDAAPPAETPEPVADTAPAEPETTVAEPQEAPAPAEAAVPAVAEPQEATAPAEVAETHAPEVVEPQEAPVQAEVAEIPEAESREAVAPAEVAQTSEAESREAPVPVEGPAVEPPEVVETPEPAVAESREDVAPLETAQAEPAPVEAPEFAPVAPSDGPVEPQAPAAADEVPEPGPAANGAHPAPVQSPDGVGAAAAEYRE